MAVSSEPARKQQQARPRAASTPGWNCQAPRTDAVSALLADVMVAGATIKVELHHRRPVAWPSDDSHWRRVGGGSIRLANAELGIGSPPTFLVALSMTSLMSCPTGSGSEEAIISRAVPNRTPRAKPFNLAISGAQRFGCPWAAACVAVSIRCPLLGAWFPIAVCEAASPMADVAEGPDVLLLSSKTPRQYPTATDPPTINHGCS